MRWALIQGSWVFIKFSQFSTTYFHCQVLKNNHGGTGQFHWGEGGGCLRYNVPYYRKVMLHEIKVLEINAP